MKRKERLEDLDSAICAVALTLCTKLGAVFLNLIAAQQRIYFKGGA